MGTWRPEHCKHQQGKLNHFTRISLYIHTILRMDSHHQTSNDRQSGYPTQMIAIWLVQDYLSSHIGAFFWDVFVQLDPYAFCYGSELWLAQPTTLIYIQLQSPFEILALDWLWNVIHHQMNPSSDCTVSPCFAWAALTLMLSLAAPPFDKQEEGGVRSTLLPFGSDGNIYMTGLLCVCGNLNIDCQCGTIFQEVSQMSAMLGKWRHGEN